MSNPHMDILEQKIKDMNSNFRKFIQTEISNCCWLKEMVYAHHVTFVGGLKTLGTDPEKMLKAFRAMDQSNQLLNKKHSTEQFKLSNYEVEAREWLVRLILR